MGDRLTDEQVAHLAVPHPEFTNNPTVLLLAAEVQASRKLIAAARVLAAASEAEIIRLTELTNPDGDFQCPSDPCPYCTATEDFADALMDYDDNFQTETEREHDARNQR